MIGSQTEYQSFISRCDPGFVDNVHQGHPVPPNFKDYHPNQSITLEGLQGLDSNFITNDPEEGAQP